jgi:hypothetical protein
MRNAGFFGLTTSRMMSELRNDAVSGYRGRRALAQTNIDSLLWVLQHEPGADEARDKRDRKEDPRQDRAALLYPVRWAVPDRPAEGNRPAPDQKLDDSDDDEAQEAEEGSDRPLAVVVYVLAPAIIEDVDCPRGVLDVSAG